MRFWVALLAAVVFASGCGPRRIVPTPRRGWLNALDVAQEYAAAGQFAAADSVLQTFTLEHPRSADTLSVLFYRALYQADPANSTEGGPAEAVALLDRYLAATAEQPQRYDALALRRFAELRAQPPVVRVDTVRTIDSTAIRAAVAREVDAHIRARDEETLRLRDSLARATAELDRIRRRLARP